MSGRERSFDVLIDSKGYIVSGSPDIPAWEETAIAPELGGPTPFGDESEAFQTAHLGYGYGESYVPGCYDYALNMDASLPGITVMGALVTSIGTTTFTAPVSGFFEIGSALYALGGRYCRRVNSDDSLGATDGTVTGQDFGATHIATKAVEYDGAIYIGFSDATSRKIDKFTGSAWSTSADVAGKYWAKDWFDSYNFRLWRAYATVSVKVLSVGTDPMSEANWVATAFTIGDSTRGIVGMLAQNQVLWVTKTDGLYTLDWTGRTPNVLQFLSGLVEADNGRNPITDGASIILPHMMGLIQYAEGGVRSIHPGAKTGNTSPIRGKVTAQALLGDWHYIALYTGTDTFGNTPNGDTYILKGRIPKGEAMPQGWIGPMIWHPIIKRASIRVDAMHITALTSPARLYWGETTAALAYNLAYARVSATGDFLDDTGMRYATSGSMYYSPITFGRSGVVKELIGFDIENTGFDATTYAALYVSLDGGSYTQWGGNAATAGKTRLTLPSGTWSSYRSKVRLDVTNAMAAGTTPKIKPVVARAALRPTIYDVITTEIFCMDDLKLRDGTTERRDGATMLTALKALRTGAPITLVDYWTGAARSQTALVERVEARVIKQRGYDPAGYGAQVTMRVVT